MAKVAFLGLGAMGSRMAARLIGAGHALTVWNRTAERADALAALGAAVAATPRDAAAGCDAAIAMVRDDAASRAVWLDPETGALASLPAGALAVECSTLTPGWVRTLAAEAAARGALFLDGPVAGSRPQAEAGALVHLAGGGPEAVARAAPILSATGAALHHVGPVGAGAAVKLAVNAMLALQVAGLAELVGYLRSDGLDAARAAEALLATPVASPAAKGALGAILAGSHAPSFPLDLALKDLGYALDAAEAVDARLPAVEAVRAVFAEAGAAGLGGLNLTAVAGLFAPPPAP